jgi:hypothetical protein
MIKEMVKGFLSLVQRPPAEWDFAERRKLTRMRCHYKCEMELEGKKLEGIIIDMGVGGLRLKVFHPLKKGQRLLIHSPFNEVSEDSAAVDVQVLWTHQPERNFATYAGLKYISEPKVMGKTWVRSVMKQLGFRPESLLSKRRWVRADCYLPGTLRRSDNSRQEIRIQNLGVGGVLFEYRGVLQLGEQSLRLGPHEQLPPLDVQGILIKARPQGKQYLYGLEFDDLKPAQLRLLTVYLKTLLIHSWET